MKNIDELQRGDKIQFKVNNELITDTITKIHIGLAGINYYTKKGYVVSRSYLINSSK